MEMLQSFYLKMEMWFVAVFMIFFLSRIKKSLKKSFEWNELCKKKNK
jgi:hypothetical protein